MSLAVLYVFCVQDYLTPLHVAAHCGNVNVAKLLLDCKCQVDACAMVSFILWSVRRVILLYGLIVFTVYFGFSFSVLTLC